MGVGGKILILSFGSVVFLREEFLGQYEDSLLQHQGSWSQRMWSLDLSFNLQQIVHMLLGESGMLRAICAQGKLWLCTLTVKL